MVFTINDPYSGNIFGRLGAGIGKGISDTLPDRIKRERIANELEEAETRTDEKGNPLSANRQAAGLIRKGGVEEALKFLPQLQTAQRRQAELDQGGKNLDNQQLNAKESIRPASASEPTSETPKPLKTHQIVAEPEKISSYKQSLIKRPKTEDYAKLGREYLAMGRFQDPDEAREFAKKELDTDFKTQEKNIEDFREDFNSRTSLSLQNAGLGDFKDNTGFIQQKLVDEGEKKVFGEGKTVQQAADETDAILYELGKATTQAKRVGAYSFLPGKGMSAAQKASSLKAQKKIFERYGFGKQFDEIAASAAGITPLQVAAILDPDENKEFDKELSKIKTSNIPAFSTIANSIANPVNAIFSKGTFQRLGDRDLNDLVNTIKKTDNILSLEHKLRERKIDISEFKNKLLEPENYNKLSDDQQKQLTIGASNSILDDLLFRFF